MTAAPDAHKLEWYAIVAPGLEALAMAEARAAGLPAREEQGGFAWRGDLASGLLANAALRIPSRVVARLASFEARSFAELQRHARRIPWSMILRAGEVVSFRVTCKKSRLYHSDAVAQRMGAAAEHCVAGVRWEGSGAADDEGEGSDAVNTGGQLVIVRVFRDVVTVSADASGELLHRRGWRQATAKAPMRETLAAAMLAAAGWAPGTPLVDPMCGAGTLPIEGALMAAGIAPGLGRGFAMERWATVPAGLGEAIRARLRETLVAVSTDIHGSDRDTGAIRAAASNAERAGVGKMVTWSARAISSFEVPAGAPGLIVVNPPYGIRVGEADRVRDLWATFGRVARERARGWRLAVLSPDPALERQLGVAMRVAASTSNGGIPVRIVVGEL